MSTKMTIECDGCNTELDIDHPESPDFEITEANWKEDQETCDVHYCPKCWVQVLKENPAWES